jgi:outer membrane cobalamin receptor
LRSPHISGFPAALVLAPAAWLLLVAARPCSADAAADRATSESEPAAQPSPPPSSPAAGVDTLDAITVEAPRPDRLDELRGLPVFFSYLDVDRSTERVTSVADVLEQAAGVRVRRMGGLGSFSTACIRGSDPGQVEVYLDGIPLNSAASGLTNLADLPVDNLDHIEVYRGVAPPEFASAGIGGVINLVTRSAGKTRRLASVSRGSFDTWKADAFAAGSVGRLEHVVAVHHLQSRGDYPYLDRRGTTRLNTEDDREVRRGNNRFRQTDVLARLVWEPGPPSAPWRIELADNPFWKENGIPGIENIPVREAHVRDFRNLARVSVEPPRLLGRSLGVRLRAFHVHRRDRFHNPEKETGLPRWGTDNETRSYGAGFLGTFHEFRTGQRLRASVEVRRESFTPEDENPRVGEGFTRRRERTTLVLEDRLTAWGERLSLVAAYRHEETSDNFFGPVPFGRPPEPSAETHRLASGNPRFGVRLSFSPFVLKANWARYARFPTLTELFGADGFVLGNPELEPEEGTTTDIGLAVEPGANRGLRGRLETVLFRSDRERLILFLPSSQRTVKAFNMETARVEGVEVSGRLVWRERLRLAGAYTRMEAVNTGPSPLYHGKRLPYTSPHALFLRTELDIGPFTLRHEFEYRGEAFRDRANLDENRMEPRHLHDLGATLRLFGRRLAVTAEVQNLTGVQAVDVEGFPLPGRMVFLTVELESGDAGAPAQDWDR